METSARNMETGKSEGLHEVGRVQDYKREGVFDYPGRRPECSYITDGEVIFGLSADNEIALSEIDSYLGEQGLAPLNERIPVLAYGANASPGSLKKKFSKYDALGLPISDKELQTVPCMFGNLAGMDVVWHGEPGQVGGYFAELYKGEETKDTEVQVVVQFLTNEQMAIMHTTEGITYEFAEIGSVKLGGNFSIDNVVSYVARGSSVLLDENKVPVSVSGIKRSGDSELKNWDVREALDYTLSAPEVAQVVGGQTADEYVAEGQQMTLVEKKARQREVRAVMEKASMTKDMKFPIAYEKVFTTGGFSMLPRFGMNGESLKSNDGTKAIGYVEFGELSKLRRPAEVRESLRLSLQKEHPDKTPEEIAKMVDPVLFRLGELAVAAAKYYYPGLDNDNE